MRTRPCPVCNEIIPADVDYCPFCGESTIARVETEEDIVAARNAEARIADAAATNAPQATDPPLDPTRHRAHVCMMCHRAPPVDGEYCAECKEKLSLGPKQWDLMRQERIQRNITIAIILLVLVLTMACIIGAGVLKRRGAAVYGPPPRSIRYESHPAGSPPDIGPGPDDRQPPPPPPGAAEIAPPPSLPGPSGR